MCRTTAPEARYMVENHRAHHIIDEYLEERLTEADRVREAWARRGLPVRRLFDRTYREGGRGTWRVFFARIRAWRNAWRRRVAWATLRACWLARQLWKWGVSTNRRT